MRRYQNGGDRVYSSGTPWEHGSKITAGDYPFQGLDLATREYDYHWLELARYSAIRARELGQNASPAGWIKELDVTPLGTPVCELMRRADGMPGRGGWDQAADAWREGDSGDQSWT